MKLAGVLLIAVLGLGGALGWLRARHSPASGPCTMTVPPGGDIGRALLDAPADATVCLTAGTYPGFSVATLRPGVTLAGDGAGQTVIESVRRNTVDLMTSERITLRDLTLRGGNPAGLYASRVRGLRLEKVEVEQSAIGVHLEGGATAELVEVNFRETAEFGLLVRRAASVAADRLTVEEHRGIGVAAVDQPGGLTLRRAAISGALPGTKGEALVLNGNAAFTLIDVTVHGGTPAGIYVANARALTMQRVRIDTAVFGLHLDHNTPATLTDVGILNSTGVGLLVQRGATVNGSGMYVLDAKGTGVSLINGPGPFTLRDSRIERVVAAGLFAGVAGCADLPPASLEIPPCFYDDLPGQISTARVTLERLHMADTQGPCLVFFPGSRAEIRESRFTRCELTGMFAWGATVDIAGATFEDNAEHAIEYRAFPDPRREVIRAAEGTVQDTVIRGTRPLQGAVLGSADAAPVLGGGLLAQGSRMSLLRVTVEANRDIGVAYVNRSTGQVHDSRILDNGNWGLCVFAGSAVEAGGNDLRGNRSDSPAVCGGSVQLPAGG